LKQQVFTDPIVNKTPVTTSDIIDIRSKINNIKTYTYTDSTLEKNKTVIKEVHFSELENIIKALATHPLQDGTSDCNSACTGMCVSCTGGCHSDCSGTCLYGCSARCGNSGS
jgi:hypothetical protein